MDADNDGGVAALPSSSCAAQPGCPRGDADTPKRRFFPKRDTSHLPDFNPYSVNTPSRATHETDASEFEGLSLREIYSKSCEKHSCKRNTQLCKLLPDSPDADIEVLDLSLNFVGRLGMRPVLDVIRASRTLTTVSFADNFLDNAGMHEVLSAVDGCTNINSLNFSRNPISQSGGKFLNALLRNNSNITHVLLDDTLINPALKASILEKALQHAKLSHEERASRLQQQEALRANHREQQQLRLQKKRENTADGPPAEDNYDTLCVLLCEGEEVEHQELRNLALLLDSA